MLHCLQNAEQLQLTTWNLQFFNLKDLEIVHLSCYGISSIELGGLGVVVVGGGHDGCSCDDDHSGGEVVGRAVVPNVLFAPRSGDGGRLSAESSEK